jgi:hypothetical protein
MAQFAPLPAAGTRSGTTSARAPSTTSAMRWHVCVRHATGAGAAH